MDPVYAGIIAGLTILFGLFLCSLVAWAYMEYRTSQREQYAALES
jgi:cbb3-type cytochrome oxidase subunit 3